MPYYKLISNFLRLGEFDIKKASFSVDSLNQKVSALLKWNDLARLSVFSVLKVLLEVSANLVIIF